MTYEYLLAGLPELKAGADAPVSLEKLEELFDEQLSESDKRLLDLLRVPIDAETLAQGLHAKNRFVREWFAFNRDMNNVLVAQICRKHGFDVKQQIVGDDEVAEQLRTHSAQKDFGLSEVMGEFQEILALAQIEDLMAREKAIDAIRFEWLSTRTEFDFFSAEMVFAYYLEAVMLHRWSILTVEEGERVFRGMVAEMKKGVRLDA
ncbi:MAG: DUF2764 family protein [Paludibacteraceae bacterium]|jgi:hypothetical protein|nr:DUF2764 family protein [Paludibacteraceae bacterium]MBQ4395098.1 DUF2764 family protein [Paludibacteraceae bacterium]MBQ6748096.1 DUF2764 family protein [Paludibacteraceae bacterium]MBQ6763835.1 DUF2764 family protein [Paludibacteraceae bacterium]MBR0065347.1 DUF2764 family protein [Paludibacteraceae bacterium]